MTTSEAASASTTVTPALAGIHHVGLTVTDVESSCEWYQRVLGLQRQFQEPHHRSDHGGYAVVLRHHRHVTEPGPRPSPTQRR